MTEDSKVAILVITYRRPREAERVFASLDKERNRRIYVFCDGPANDLELELQKEIRRATLLLSEKHEVLTKFESTHLGLRRGVLSAIDWFFEHEPSGIIIEDDIVPSREFFDFCDQGLRRFEAVHEVQQLVGYNPFGNKFGFYGRHIFSSRMDCWGWATWKDRWTDFRDEETPLEIPSDWKWAPRPVVEDLNRGRLLAESGVLDSWAYSWAWHALTKKKLSVVPAVNLIDNIGFNSSATHTKNGRAARPGLMRRTYEFPQKLAPNRAYVWGAQWLQSSQLWTLRQKRKLLRRAKWGSSVLKKLAQLSMPISHRDGKL